MVDDGTTRHRYDDGPIRERLSAIGTMVDDLLHHQNQDGELVRDISLRLVRLEERVAAIDDRSRQAKEPTGKTTTATLAAFAGIIGGFMAGFAKAFFGR